MDDLILKINHTYSFKSLNKKEIIKLLTNNDETFTELTLSGLDTPYYWDLYEMEDEFKIFEAIKTNTILTNLKINNSSLKKDYMIYIYHVLKNNTSITSLNFHFNRINNIKYLSKILIKNKPILKLDLSKNYIDSKLKSLYKALKVNSTLTSLNLTKTLSYSGQTKLKSLSEALKVNSTLTSLNLSKNKIDIEGIKSLSEALKVNSTLTSLNLSKNNINIEGIKSLSEALKVNSTLTKLNIECNEKE